MQANLYIHFSLIINHFNACLMPALLFMDITVLTVAKSGLQSTVDSSCL